MFELTRRSNYPTAYDPFRQMEAFHRRFFGDMMDDFFSAPAISQFRTDVTDEGDHYLLQTDLPGFDKKDIHLDLDGNVLTVRAERSNKVEKKDRDKVVRMERTYGSYTRSYDLTGIDHEGITAKYTDGVLMLTLPKLQTLPNTARQIQIQ